MWPAPIVLSSVFKGQTRDLHARLSTKVDRNTSTRPSRSGSEFVYDIVVCGLWVPFAVAHCVWLAGIGPQGHGAAAAINMDMVSSGAYAQRICVCVCMCKSYPWRAYRLDNDAKDDAATGDQGRRRDDSDR